MITGILALVFSPVGRWLAGATAIIAVLLSLGLYFDHKGASRIQARWDAANRAAALAAQRRDVDAAVSVDKGSDDELAQIKKDLASVTKERDKLATLAPTPMPKCAPAGDALDQRFRDSLRVPARRPATGR